MNAWAYAGIAALSYAALVVGYTQTLKLIRRHQVKHAAPLLCVMCELNEVRDDERVTCSDTCLDMWLGEIGAKQ